jgi:hypothetical protein
LRLRPVPTRMPSQNQRYHVVYPTLVHVRKRETWKVKMDPQHETRIAVAIQRQFRTGETHPCPLPCEMLEEDLLAQKDIRPLVPLEFPPNGHRSSPFLLVRMRRKLGRKRSRGHLTVSSRIDQISLWSPAKSARSHVATGDDGRMYRPLCPSQQP